VGRRAGRELPAGNPRGHGLRLGPAPRDLSAADRHLAVGVRADGTPGRTRPVRPDCPGGIGADEPDGRPRRPADAGRDVHRGPRRGPLRGDRHARRAHRARGVRDGAARGRRIPRFTRVVPGHAPDGLAHAWRAAPPPGVAGPVLGARQRVPGPRWARVPPRGDGCPVPPAVRRDRASGPGGGPAVPGDRGPPRERRAAGGGGRRLDRDPHPRGDRGGAGGGGRAMRLRGEHRRGGGVAPAARARHVRGGGALDPGACRADGHPRQAGRDAGHDPHGTAGGRRGQRPRLRRAARPRRGCPRETFRRGGDADRRQDVADTRSTEDARSSLCS
jgi:hypothetical protein